VLDERVLTISGEADIVTARQAARQFAAALGFNAMDQSRITTAVSELARNVVRYATNSHGVVHVRETEADGRTGIEIVVADEGPGIADTEQAMRRGFSSGNGLGLGLSGTGRLMDEMDMKSAPGEGTCVTIRKWRR